MEIKKKKIEEIIDDTDYELDNVDLMSDTSDEETEEVPIVVEETPIQAEDVVVETIEQEETDDTPIAISGTDITEKKLQALKEEYRKLYQTEFDDDIFIWHALSRTEFTTIVNDTVDIEDDEQRIIEREKLFVKTACIYPNKESKEMTSFLNDEDVMTTTLSNEILQRSGFVPPKTKRL